MTPISADNSRGTPSAHSRAVNHVRFLAPLLLVLSTGCNLHLCEGPEVAGTSALRVERGQACPTVDEASARLVHGSIRSVTGFHGQADAPGSLVCVYDAHTHLPVFDGASEVYYYASSSETCAAAADILRDHVKYPLVGATYAPDARTLFGAPSRKDLTIVEVLDGPHRVDATPDTCRYHVRLHGDEARPIVKVRSVVAFSEGTLDVARCPAPSTMTSAAKTAAGTYATVETIDPPVLDSSSQPLGTSCTYDVIRRNDADHCG